MHTTADQNSQHSAEIFNDSTTGRLSGWQLVPEEFASVVRLLIFTYGSSDVIIPTIKSGEFVGPHSLLMTH